MMIFSLIALVVFALVAGAGIVFLIATIAAATFAAIAIALLVSFRRTRAIGVASALAGALGALIASGLYAVFASVAFDTTATTSGTIISAMVGFAWLSAAAVVADVVVFGSIAAIRHSLRYFSISFAFSSIARSCT